MSCLAEDLARGAAGAAEARSRADRRAARRAQAGPGHDRGLARDRRPRARARARASSARGSSWRRATSCSPRPNPTSISALPANQLGGDLSVGLVQVAVLSQAARVASARPRTCMCAVNRRVALADSAGGVLVIGGARRPRRARAPQGGAPGRSEGHSRFNRSCQWQRGAHTSASAAHSCKFRAAGGGRGRHGTQSLRGVRVNRAPQELQSANDPRYEVSMTRPASRTGNRQLPSRPVGARRGIDGSAPGSRRPLSDDGEDPRAVIEDLARDVDPGWWRRQGRGTSASSSAERSRWRWRRTG